MRKIRKKQAEYIPATPANPTGYYLFVRRYPERRSGFVALPTDTGEDKITIVPTMKKAHRYSNDVPPEMWLEMIRDNVTLEEEDKDIKEPEWTWIEI